jgi:serine/threonine protein kinase
MALILPQKFDVGDTLYQRVKTLHHGNQGNVYVVRRRRYTNRIVEEQLVCKVQRCPLGERPHEVRVLQDLLDEHPRITHLDCWFRRSPESPVANMLFEYCELGDLWGVSEKYHKIKYYVPEGFIWHVFIQLSEALSYLHYGHGKASEKSTWSTPIIHRDIKPENVFLKVNFLGGPKDYPDVVLGDFGYAIATSDSLYNPWDHSGTNDCQPPDRKKASPESDVWALGATVYSLCHEGRAPIERRPPASWKGTEVQWLLSAKARRPMPIPTIYSGLLQTFLGYTLRFSLERRINSLDLARELGRIGPEQREKHYYPLVELKDEAGSKDNTWCGNEGRTAYGRH